MPVARHSWQRTGTVRLVLLLGALIGVSCGVVAAGIPLLAPQLLTRDANVWPFMSSVAPQALLSMLLVATDVASAAVLLACRDLVYLARAFTLTFAALVAYIVLGVQPHGWGLSGVWWGLTLFFGLRAVQSTARVAWLIRSGRLGGSPPPAAAAG